MSKETSQTVGSKSGTILKTFRIPKRLYSELQEEAETRGLSPNALVSTIFTKFVDWDRYARRFGYVSISREALDAIMGPLDREHLHELAYEMGKRLPKDAMMFWFKKATIETFLAYLKNTCTFGGQAEYECQVSGRDYTITLRHDFGSKWSDWLESVLDGALRSIFSIAAQFEVSESEVIARFYAPPAASARKL